MVYLYGKKYSKIDLLTRTGDISQIAGVHPVELVNGSERGVRVLQFYTGSGLSFSVLGDRALDIFQADFQGMSLCWHSPTGATAPSFAQFGELDWLWSFYGGLVVTCGLTQAGAPSVDQGEKLGLHGRVSNIPAKNINYGCEWQENHYVLWASGEVREARLFGPNLRMKRKIYTYLGESRLWIEDVIENCGFEDTPLMLLYHCNIGFPVVDEGSELLASVSEIKPRDQEAEKGVHSYDKFKAPVSGFREQCFFIDQTPDKNGRIFVALVNRNFNREQGLGVYLSYSKNELPLFTLWKMMGEGSYVVGMEPGNCYPEGRAAARERGALEILQPGETRKFHLEIGVLENNDKIQIPENRLNNF
ncbi:aldose 1-epimerase family protein [candidate division KSB1 bacterium]|nr:aldose 1-epimerase family protein [candidate division KSB1 bacterium]